MSPAAAPSRRRGGGRLVQHRRIEQPHLHGQRAQVGNSSQPAWANSNHNSRFWRRRMPRQARRQPDMTAAVGAQRTRQGRQPGDGGGEPGAVWCRGNSSSPAPALAPALAPAPTLAPALAPALVVREAHIHRSARLSSPLVSPRRADLIVFELIVHATNDLEVIDVTAGEYAAVYAPAPVVDADTAAKTNRPLLY